MQDGDLASPIAQVAGDHGTVAAVVAAAAKNADGSGKPVWIIVDNGFGAGPAGVFHQDPGWKPEIFDGAQIQILHLG